MKLDVTKIKGLSTEMIMSLSACIDKMEIAEDLKKLEINTGNELADNEELGKELIVLLISRLYKAKDEVYEMIANYKEISVEEAKKANVIPIIQEILGIQGVTDFLSQT